MLTVGLIWRNIVGGANWGDELIVVFGEAIVTVSIVMVAIAWGAKSELL
jgi:hypothetical protein